MHGTPSVLTSSVLSWLGLTGGQRADYRARSRDEAHRKPVQLRHFEAPTKQQTIYQKKVVSDIAVFVLKRDVKLEPTNQPEGHS